MEDIYFFITSAQFPEGNASSVYINQFLKGLSHNKKKTELFLLSSRNKIDNSTEYGIKYSFLSNYKFKNRFIDKLNLNFKLIFKLPDIFKKIKNKNNKITILVYNNILSFNILIYIYSFLFKISVVTFVPEYYEKPSIKSGFFKIINWYCFIINLYYINRLSNKLIVFSSYLKNLYVNNGFDERKIWVQPNLTDFEFWKSDKEEINYNIGYSGSAVAKDGLIFLFEALKILKDNKIIKTVLIVGDLPYGKSVLPSLRDYCKQLGILEQITFTGLIPHNQVKNYLNKCEILILPRTFSKKTQAGFPTKLGEYFACKKIIIASKFGDIEKYFSNKKNLIIIDKLEPEIVAESIIWVYQNPQKSNEIKLNGYDRAFQVFDYKLNVLKIIDFIENNN